MPETLAQLVRAKYPGSYDDLSDQAIEAAVRTKFPGVYDDLPMSGAKPSTAEKAPVSFKLGDVARGKSELASLDAERKAQFKSADSLVDAYVNAGPGQVKRGIQDIGRGNFSKGANAIIVGTGITAAPMVAPQVIPAIMAAPGAAALTAGAGMAANAVVPPVARAMGATEDQSALAGTVAGIGAGTGMAELGVPALARAGARRTAGKYEKDYLQARRDTMAALGVKGEDVDRSRPFLEAVHAQSVPIVGKEDAAAQLVKASELAVNEIEQHVASIVAQFPKATVPALGSAIRTRVGRMPGALASDTDAAEKVIAEYGLDRARSLAEAESLRVRLNADNRSILEGSGVRQRTAVLTNPAYVARQQAAESLRDGIYNTLQQRGVSGIRDLRMSEGSILAVRNAADPLTRGLRSESTVARTGKTSFLRRMAQRTGPVVGASAGAAVGGPVGAAAGAELGRDMTTGLAGKNLSRNELLERAFRQSFTSPPVMDFRQASLTRAQ